MVRPLVAEEKEANEMNISAWIFHHVNQQLQIPNPNHKLDLEFLQRREATERRSDTVSTHLMPSA